MTGQPSSNKAWIPVYGAVQFITIFRFSSDFIPKPLTYQLIALWNFSVSSDTLPIISAILQKSLFLCVLINHYYDMSEHIPPIFAVTHPLSTDNFLISLPR